MNRKPHYTADEVRKFITELEKLLNSGTWTKHSPSDFIRKYPWAVCFLAGDHYQGQILLQAISEGHKITIEEQPIEDLGREWMESYGDNFYLQFMVGYSSDKKKKIPIIFTQFSPGKFTFCTF